jgi:hypothetical protein
MGVRALAPQSAPANTSVADILVKLASLRDRGILSAEEFEEQEAMLLGSSPLGSRVAVEDVEDKPSETKLKMMGRWSRQIRSTLTTTAAPTFVNAWRSDANCAFDQTPRDVDSSMRAAACGYQSRDKLCACAVD